MKTTRIKFTRIATMAALLAALVAVLYALRLQAADPAAPAQNRAGKGQCVGITSERLSATVVRVYRAFEDGTIEATDDAAGSRGDWIKVGR